MRSDIALAIIGALIGVTVAQLKGDLIPEYLSRVFRERWQKVFRTPGQGDKASE